MTDQLSHVPTIRVTKTIALNVSSSVEMSRIQNVRKIKISEKSKFPKTSKYSQNSIYGELNWKRFESTRKKLFWADVNPIFCQTKLRVNFMDCFTPVLYLLHRSFTPLKVHFVSRAQTFWHRVQTSL